MKGHVVQSPDFITEENEAKEDSQETAQSLEAEARAGSRVQSPMLFPTAPPAFLSYSLPAETCDSLGKQEAPV